MIDFPCIAGHGAFVSLGDRTVQAHIFWNGFLVVACFESLGLESYSLYKIGPFVSTCACISRSLLRLATSMHIFLCQRPSLQLFGTLGKKLAIKPHIYGCEARSSCRDTDVLAAGSELYQDNHDKQ